jgi:hypothetical protein
MRRQDSLASVGPGNRLFLDAHACAICKQEVAGSIRAGSIPEVSANGRFLIPARRVLAVISALMEALLKPLTTGGWSSSRADG